MARRRMIDPHFWESGDINKLDIFARYVFISMFSHADDEGRGIGGAVYIRNITFPFEDIPLAKIKKAIEAIKAALGVEFYEVDGTDYYQLTNWDKWQRVDKPQPSLLPTYSENDSKNDSRIDSVLKEKKIKEEKGREEKDNSAPARERFKRPTVEEVQSYCLERKNGIDPEAFINFYDSKGWMIGKNPMKDWKAAVRTWEQKRKERQQDKQTESKDNATLPFEKYGLQPLPPEKVPYLRDAVLRNKYKEFYANVGIDVRC